MKLPAQHHRGLAAPNLPQKGGPRRAVVPRSRDVGGFTVLEIMIVVSIVSILSWLSMVAIARIQDRASRTLVTNNLRQIYQAKEYYYSATGNTDMRTVTGLINDGYLKTSMNAQLTPTGSFEGNLGWIYPMFYWPGEPAYAYQGENPGTPGPNNTVVWTQTSGEVIWYPGPPAELAQDAGSSAPAPAPDPVISSPAPTPDPVVTTPTPDPVTTPDTTTAGSTTTTTTTITTPTTPGPGNSDFGHSQGKDDKKDKDKKKD